MPRTRVEVTLNKPNQAKPRSLSNALTMARICLFTVRDIDESAHTVLRVY